MFSLMKCAIVTCMNAKLAAIKLIWS